jgi:hypothetical protein
MRALQLHYTSCRRGLAASAGFQVRALTTGIQPDEQREIERRGVYRPPRTAPPTPSDEEIARDFPRALRYYPLSSGRWALTLASYTGRDYSGRWGNFFAHTLVFDGPPPALWPVDLFEWEGWKHRLLPAEDTDDPPAPLAPVELEELRPAESFALPELAAFLAEEPGRAALLARMGRAALAVASSSRAVVVRDSPLNGLYWVACVQKLFPPGHAVGLSFSTFQDDPRGAAPVNATVEGTDFSFAEAERRYRFAMFDLTTGVHSDLEDAADYSACAARWLAEDPGKLQDFFEFMKRFDHRALEGEALLAAARLFEIGRREGGEIGGGGLAAAIGFAARHATAAGCGAVVEQLGDALAAGPPLPEPADYEAAARFLAAGAAATGQPRHRTLAFALWRRLWSEEVVARGQGIPACRAAWDALREALPAQGGDFAGWFLGRETLGLATNGAGELSADALTLALELAGASLAELGRGPLPAQPEVRSLVSAWMAAATDPEAAAAAVLRGVEDRPAILAGTVHLMLEANGPSRTTDGGADEVRRAVGGALGRRLAELDRATAQAVRRELDDPATWEVLFGEWQVLSRGAEDLGRCYESYRAQVLAALPGYGASCLPRVAASLLDQMPEPQRIRQAADWLLRGDAAGFPGDLRRRSIELANAALTLTAGDDLDRLAALVAETAAAAGIELRPDRPRLRRLARAAAGGQEIPRTALGPLPNALAALGAEEYEAFLAAFLAPALAGLNLAEHERVLRACLADRHPAEFLRAYSGFLRAQPAAKGLAALQAAIKFWVAVDGTAPGGRRLAAMRTAVFDEIARALCRLPKRKLKSLRERMDQAKLRGERLERWREIEARIEERSAGFGGRLRRLLGRA